VSALSLGVRKYEVRFISKRKKEKNFEENKQTGMLFPFTRSRLRLGSLPGGTEAGAPALRRSDGA